MMCISRMAMFLIYLCTVDDVSAQASCVISPDLTTLTTFVGLGRDVEFHCQCMDSNGMIITGTRWLLSDGTAAPTQDLNIPPAVLYIAGPFASSDAGTYICSSNNMANDPSRDMITLTAPTSTGEYVAISVYHYHVADNLACIQVHT